MEPNIDRTMWGLIVLIIAVVAGVLAKDKIYDALNGVFIKQNDAIENIKLDGFKTVGSSNTEDNEEFFGENGININEPGNEIETNGITIEGRMVTLSQSSIDYIRDELSWLADGANGDPNAVILIFGGVDYVSGPVTDELTKQNTTPFGTYVLSYRTTGNSSVRQVVVREP